MVEREILSFYEEKFVKPKLYFYPDSLLVKIGTLLSIYSVQRNFEKYVKPSDLLLDIGCGGGWELFTTKAKRVVGVDVSVASLKTAKELYNNCVRADIRNLPFKNNCFDSVVSSDVLGHIPVVSKECVLSEIYRVLKKGGETFHLIEANSQGILHSWTRKYPALYRKYIIDLDGHYGLEFPTRIAERFDSKFDDCIAKKIYSSLFWPITEYVKRFDNRLKDKSLFIKILVILSKMIMKNFYLHAIVDCSLGIMSRLWDAITPFNWADGIYIYCKKDGKVHNG